MLEISGTTSLLGIFGDPVKHSLSPKMQNAALEAAGIDAIYLPLHVRPESLAAAVEALRTFGFVGVNVTVPHKEAILPLLDEVDAEAALIGAVNTVVNRQGRLCGFNTDAPGFLASLGQDLEFGPADKEIVILGAGGAARAAIAALAGAGARSLLVANRTPDKAEGLVRDLQGAFPCVDLDAAALQEGDLVDRLKRADLLVNTTAVGLAGETFPDFLVASLADRAGVYDMVYAPAATPLVAAAQARGLRACDGRGMLVAQGEAAFFVWFGQSPQAGVMRAQVIEK